MTFEEIKKRIEQKKIESAKAEVRIQQIRDLWMKEFGTVDVDEVQRKIDELNADKCAAERTYMELLEKAENELLAMEAL